MAEPAQLEHALFTPGWLFDECERCLSDITACLHVLAVTGLPDSIEGLDELLAEAVTAASHVDWTQDKGTVLTSLSALADALFQTRTLGALRNEMPWPYLRAIEDHASALHTFYDASTSGFRW